MKPLSKSEYIFSIGTSGKYSNEVRLFSTHQKTPCTSLGAPIREVILLLLQ